MTVAFQRMFGILERWNTNQVTPSLSKPHELSYTSNTSSRIIIKFTTSDVITPNVTEFVVLFNQFDFYYHDLTCFSKGLANP